MLGRKSWMAIGAQGNLQTNSIPCNQGILKFSFLNFESGWGEMSLKILILDRAKHNHAIKSTTSRSFRGSIL